MYEYKEPVETFDQLKEEIKKYFEMQKEYIKLDFVEKLSIILSTMIVAIVVALMVILALFFFFLGLAHSLGSVLNNMALSYAIIASCYLLITFIFYFFRKKLVIAPLVRLLSNLFFNS